MLKKCVFFFKSEIPVKKYLALNPKGDNICEISGLNSRGSVLACFFSGVPSFMPLLEMPSDAAVPFGEYHSQGRYMFNLVSTEKTP